MLRFTVTLQNKVVHDIGPVLRRGPPTKKAIHICGQPRWVFVLAFSAASCFLWFTSCRLLTVLWALIIGIFATTLHASFRTPNLKARLNKFREEFRAVWRNYSEL
ncbi:putative prenylated rab acceptor P [Dioscorea sansibarensis]